MGQLDMYRVCSAPDMDVPVVLTDGLIANGTLGVVKVHWFASTETNYLRGHWRSHIRPVITVQTV